MNKVKKKNTKYNSTNSAFLLFACSETREKHKHLFGALEMQNPVMEFKACQYRNKINPCQHHLDH